MSAPSPDFVQHYRRYGPILYSHFYRRLGEEQRASRATRSAFEQLWALQLPDDAAIVAWVRACSVPE